MAEQIKLLDLDIENIQYVDIYVKKKSDIKSCLKHRRVEPNLYDNFKEELVSLTNELTSSSLISIFQSCFVVIHTVLPSGLTHDTLLRSGEPYIPFEALKKTLCVD